MEPSQEQRKNAPPPYPSDAPLPQNGPPIRANEAAFRYRMIEWINRHEEIGHSHKTVAINLITGMGVNGEGATISVEKLAKQSGLSVRRTKEILADFREWGMLVKKERVDGPTPYRWIRVPEEEQLRELGDRGEEKGLRAGPMREIASKCTYQLTLHKTPYACAVLRTACRKVNNVQSACAKDSEEPGSRQPPHSPDLKKIRREGSALSPAAVDPATALPIYVCPDQLGRAAVWLGHPKHTMRAPTYFPFGCTPETVTEEQLIQLANWPVVAFRDEATGAVVKKGVTGKGACLIYHGDQDGTFVDLKDENGFWLDPFDVGPEEMQAVIDRWKERRGMPLDPPRPEPLE